MAEAFQDIWHLWLWVPACAGRQLYFHDGPHILRPRKAERPAVAVLEELSGQPLRHRLHDGVVADEQDLVLRMTREPLADAKQRARGDIRPRFGIRRQHIDQP